MEIVINDHYTSQGEEYVVTGFCKIKQYGPSDNVFWADGVEYLPISAAPDSYPFTCLSTEFIHKFLPVKLKVGDEVISFSMGRVKQTYFVESIDPDGTVNYINSTLKTKDTIDMNGQLTEISSTQATEYFYNSPNISNRLSNYVKVQELKVMFTEAVSKLDTLSLGEIYPSVLQGLVTEGHQYLSKLFNTYGNK